jgi:3-hydroxybutyryl-CoA dehydratase
MNNILKYSKQYCSIRKFCIGTDKFFIKGSINADEPLIGSFVEMQHVFTQVDVNRFADLCGDNNPIHLDAAFASKTIFKGTIVHGILVSSLFSTLLGRSLTGCIYVSQVLKFKKPVHVGKAVSAKIIVNSIENRKKGKLLICSTVCSLVDDETVVIEGDGTVLVPLKND